MEGSAGTRREARKLERKEVRQNSWKGRAGVGGREAARAREGEARAHPAERGGKAQAGNPTSG